MLAYKITLTIFGDDFYPGTLPNIVTTQLRCVAISNSTDKTSQNTDEQLGFGSVMYMHNDIFEVGGQGLNYDNDFVEFLETNHTLLAEYKATEYHIFTEVYYSGAQCNFEILSFDSLIRLRKLNLDIAYPVSVYKMKKARIKDLLDKSTHWLES